MRSIINEVAYLEDQIIFITSCYVADFACST